MTPCTRCGSYAINPHCHGRNDSDLDLCDVCYWRKRAEALTAPPAQAVDLLEVNELLRIWQTHFDSGVRPDDDEPEDVALWDRIAAVRTAIDQQAGKGNDRAQ